MTRPGGHAAHPPLAAFAPLVLTMVLWGSAFSVSSLALDHVGHQAAAAMRYGFAAIVMLCVLAFSARGAPPLTRRTWGRFAFAGPIGIALVGPTTASVMMFLVPISGAALAWLLLGQTLHGLQIVGAITKAGGALLAVLSTGARRP